MGISWSHGFNYWNWLVLSMIKIENLSYTYPLSKTPALSNISFSVKPGEFVAVIGANDSGKSTLAYALTGFVPHFFQGSMSGKVSISGLDIQSTPLKKLVTVAGLVFQNPSNQISGAKFSVYEEVGFGLENLGIPREEMHKRIEETLLLMGLFDLAKRSPYELSGGQQQRLALASMIVMSPQILVLDEPTSQLDPLGSRDVFTIIKLLAKKGITVIMAEHKLEWIAAFADRVLLIGEGKIILDGSPKEVLTSPLLEKHHLKRTNFTLAAHSAQKSGFWPKDEPLPITIDEAEIGFKKSMCKGEEDEH